MYLIITKGALRQRITLLVEKILGFGSCKEFAIDEKTDSYGKISSMKKIQHNSMCGSQLT